MNDLTRLQKIRTREQHGIAPEHPVSTDEQDSDVRFLLRMIYMRDIQHVADIGTLIEWGSEWESLAVGGEGGKPPSDPEYSDSDALMEEIDAVKLPPRRKRCSACNATGTVLSTGSPPGEAKCIMCDCCNGTGYQEAGE